MIAAIAILTITVYAALAAMAVRDTRKAKTAEQRPDSGESRDGETRRRHASRRDASKRRGDAATREDRTEMTPQIRRRTPEEVREMVRLAINTHRPTISEK